MVETIEWNGKQLALILRHTSTAEGIHFFTPGSFSQQLGYMKRSAGHVIPPHVHNPVKREVEYTKEVLLIRRGVVRVDFYSEEQSYLHSAILRAGDVILLAFGGHGFQIIEEAEIIEVKQGPYAGDQDKTRFRPVPDELIVVKDAK
jgi:hypothetical protein